MVLRDAAWAALRCVLVTSVVYLYIKLNVIFLQSLPLLCGCVNMFACCAACCVVCCVLRVGVVSLLKLKKLKIYIFKI